MIKGMKVKDYIQEAIRTPQWQKKWLENEASSLIKFLKHTVQLCCQIKTCYTFSGEQSCSIEQFLLVLTGLTILTRFVIDLNEVTISGP